MLKTTASVNNKYHSKRAKRVQSKKKSTSTCDNFTLFFVQRQSFILERWSTAWMRATDTWRSKCGGQEPICPKAAPLLSALAKLNLSLPKVSFHQHSRTPGRTFLDFLNAVFYSFFQLVSTMWASVVTWTLPLVSACRPSGSPSWMTWGSQSWRGLRHLSLSFVCR